MNRKKVYVSIALLGVLLMVAGCALAGFDFGALFADKDVYTEIRKVESLGAEDAVKINVDTELIRLGLSADEQAHVTYMDSEKQKHLYDYANGALTISVDQRNRQWYDYINFSFAPTEKVVEVLLPKGFRGTLEASGATGGIEAANLTGLASMTLGMTTGDIHATDCAIADMRLTTTTGKLYLSALQGSALYAECSTGAISADGVVEASLTARSVSGDIALANATSETIEARATTGSIRLDRIVADEIALRVTTGNVSGTIACDPTEFTIDSSTTTGDNNLGNVHFGGKRKLNVETTTGAISITFAE